MSAPAARPDYKRTEVGIIPEDWDVRSVGDVCAWIVPGRNKPRVFNGDIPWITIPDLEDGKGVSESKSGLFVSRDEARNVGSRIVPSGSVIMSCVGEFGIISIADRDIVINQQLHAFIPSSIIDATFLLNALKTRKKYMASLATKTAVPYLNKDNCNSVPIPLPPIPEQRAIAAALSDVDALISALDKLIAKKHAIKQGAMQELLTGKKRLQGFGGAWDVKRLGDIADVNMGQSPDSRYYNQQCAGVPLIQGNADIVDRKSIKRVWTTQVTKVCDEGALILTVRAPVGSVGIASEQSCLGRGVCSLKPFYLHTDFLFHSLVFLEARWKRLEQGSTFTSANSMEVAEFPLLIPESKEEQQAIATLLSDMDTEIDALERRRDKTRALKQGMMQELLTGRIRLMQGRA